MKIRQVHYKNRHYLFNDELVSWDREVFADRQGVDGAVNWRGRGSVSFFRHQGTPLVRKRYRRGGLFGRLVERSYFYTGLNRTRMWQEFYLLRHMKNLGLPVPTVAAAECEMPFPLCYRGQLITQEIAGSRTLAQCLESHPLSSDVWLEVGKTVRKFHDHAIYHADLNANNIMIDESGEIWLIDFDKGKVRDGGGGTWKCDNINRLLRSLNKIRANSATFHFAPVNWEDFNRGYAHAC